MPLRARAAPPSPPPSLPAASAAAFSAFLTTTAAAADAFLASPGVSAAPRFSLSSAPSPPLTRLRATLESPGAGVGAAQPGPAHERPRPFVVVRRSSELLRESKHPPAPRATLCLVFSWPMTSATEATTRRRGPGARWRPRRRFEGRRWCRFSRRWWGYTINRVDTERSVSGCVHPLTRQTRRIPRRRRRRRRRPHRRHLYFLLSPRRLESRGARSLAGSNGRIAFNVRVPRSNYHLWYSVRSTRAASICTAGDSS